MVLGYWHLRHLVVKWQFVQPVLCEPNCQLGTHLHTFIPKYPRRKGWAPSQATLKATKDLVLENAWCPDYCDWSSQHDMCQHCQDLQTLTIDWPMCCKRDRCNYNAEQLHGECRARIVDAEGSLRLCIPVNWPHLANLRVLTITANSAMMCSIPTGMPNLEELVLFAKGAAEVSFDNPIATLSALKVLYMFGQPLMAHISKFDKSWVLDYTAERGFSLSTASETPTESSGKTEKLYRRGSSCMYLRPITTQELSLKDLYDIANTLATQCRCKACFDCLRRGGCLAW